MPINPKLKDQLTKQIADAAYRDKLIATLEDAPPEVQNNWMSQEDYTRNVNAFKVEQADWNKKATDYYKDTNAKVDEWKAEVAKYQGAAAAAEARITELQAGTGAIRNPAQEDAAAAEIKKLQTMLGTIEGKLNGVVTEEALRKAVSTEYQNAVGFLGEQNMKIRTIARLHEKTFGKEFGEAEEIELWKFANDLSAKEGKRVPMDIAYKTKYETDLKEKERAAIYAEAEEKFKTQHHIPTGGADGVSPGGGSELGPLQLRLKQEREIAAGGKPAGAYATWQEAAAAASDELVKEGKF